jgi:hypothetical protein
MDWIVGIFHNETGGLSSCMDWIVFFMMTCDKIDENVPLCSLPRSFSDLSHTHIYALRFASLRLALGAAARRVLLL